LKLPSLRRQRRHKVSVLDVSHGIQWDEMEACSHSNLVDAEIILFENSLIVYRFNVDVYLYLVGHPDENELMLWKFLSAYYESLMLLLK
jgi:hypothetical protein